MDNQLAQAISQGIVEGMKQMQYGLKAPVVTPTTNIMHGPNGLFGIAGIDHNVLSLRVAPTGISTVLKAFPDRNMNPLYPYITGIQTLPGQNEPQTRCETCLSSEIEACLQTAQYGYVCRETATLEPSRLIERVNSGESDLTLVNDILGGGGDVMAAINRYDKGSILQVATTLAMLQVGMMFQNALAPMYWTGNPVNNVGTGYMEFPGLDILIGVNKVDAVTGARCQALDSDVKDFAYQNINTVAGNTFLIVRLLSYLEEYIYRNAVGQHLLPCEWVWVMRPELWYELTEVWPVAYLTTRNITLPAGNTHYMDATRINDMRDNMRRSMTLSVNGRTHRVVEDTGVHEQNPADTAHLIPGEFASNIYLVPLKYLGNRDGTYLQFKDYRFAAPDIKAARLTEDMWTDDGRFRWTHERLKFCYTLSGTVEPRIILKVPQLAGRLNNVKYVPAQHFRDWDEDSDYFYKGGVSVRDSTPYYSDWNMPSQ
jgi:hypothetical protein